MLKALPVTAGLTQVTVGAADGLAASYDIDHAPSSLMHSKSLWLQAGAVVGGALLTLPRNRTAREVGESTVLSGLALLGRRGAFAAAQSRQATPARAQGAVAHGNVYDHIVGTPDLVPPTHAGVSAAGALTPPNIRDVGMNQQEAAVGIAG